MKKMAGSKAIFFQSTGVIERSGQTQVPRCYLERLTSANDTTGFSEDVIKKCSDLEKAFHDKSNTDEIKRLITAGALVNYRLDYGLEIKLESEFVYQLYLLLEGDQGEEKLAANTAKIYGKGANEIANYVRTAPVIHSMLYDNMANTTFVPLNSAYQKALLQHAIDGRANPDHKNSSLIIAAGLRDPALISEIIQKGKETQVKPELNGAAVDFFGYFEETAAVWSTILLDLPSLQVFLNNHTTLENIGVTKSSLLHWLAVAVKMDASQERLKIAKDIVNKLIEHGIDLQSKNILGKTAADYAIEEFKEYVESLTQVKNTVRLVA